MTPPSKGDRVRFRDIVGVASSEMRAYVGDTGTVKDVRTEGGRVRVCVRFGPPGLAGPTFWLQAGEWEPVAPVT